MNARTWRVIFAPAALTALAVGPRSALDLFVAPALTAEADVPTHWGMTMDWSVAAIPDAATPAAAVRLRAAQASDLDAVDEFVDRLSLASRVKRFFAPLRRLPEALRRAIAEGDPMQRFVVAEQRHSIVGLGQRATSPNRLRCEVALVVADAWQGGGIGRRLLERLLSDAARAGLREAVLETLPDNRAMRALAEKAGFILMRHPEDPRLVFGRRALVDAWQDARAANALRRSLRRPSPQAEAAVVAAARPGGSRAAVGCNRQPGA